MTDFCMYKSHIYLNTHVSLQDPLSPKALQSPTRPTTTTAASPDEFDTGNPLRKLVANYKLQFHYYNFVQS